MEQSKTLGKIWVVTFAPNQDQRVPCVTSSAFPSFCSITRRLRSASGAGRARGLSSPSHFQQPNRRKEGKQLKSSSMAEPRGDCSCPCRNGWDNTQDKVHPRNLIPELCQQFYHLGWVTGTGGGISIKHGDEIYIAPSGVQKERIQPEDMFVCDIEEQDISGPPSHKKLKKSQCTPLFMNAYTMRANLV
ncbi:methylthioribulose-1-phosphate dehydratase isoform X3 [Anolis carolinensis]|uniref:methylthioribulose-1-phosphate dehydratase isoform X3 n=1 Tax=Anolis carolinensis TaxID=28377 RepID=UPI002F2B34AE